MSQFPSVIDLVIFINLDIRTDRKEEMQKELSRLGVPQEKILRWSAVRNTKNPALGCTLSHIAVLEHINTLPENIENILILEDDFDFAEDASLVNESLKKFLQYPRESWELGLLSYYVLERQDHNSLVSVALMSQRTSGYLVNRNSLLKLLNNFKKGRDCLIQTGNIALYSIDVYWWHLMQDKKCFYFNQPLGYQRKSYSNISREITRRESLVQIVAPQILKSHRG